MKKLFILILLLFLTLFFVACGDSAPATEGNSLNPDLDFKSVLDTETGNIFSLGEHRSVFDDAFGEGEETLSNPQHNTVFVDYVFENPTSSLSVAFVDDIAFWIHTNSDRFVFAEASFDMTIGQLRERFAEVDDPYLEEGHATFRRSYYQDGNITENPDSTVFHTTVSTRDETAIFISLMNVAQFREAAARNGS